MRRAIECEERDSTRAISSTFRPSRTNVRNFSSWAFVQGWVDVYKVLDVVMLTVSLICGFMEMRPTGQKTAKAAISTWTGELGISLSFVNQICEKNRTQGPGRSSERKLRRQKASEFQLNFHAIGSWRRIALNPTKPG